MMKNRLKIRENKLKLTTLAFTLVELLAVVAILSILAIIITPIIDKNIKKSKEEMYQIQIENIRMAGQNYYVNNILLRPTEGNYASVRLTTLIEEEYIGNNIKNPKTGQNFTENIYVQIKNNRGTYTYLVCPIENNCEAYVE